MFYGWKLAILGLVGNFVLQGSIIFMMNAFIDPLGIERGWTRANVSLGMSIASLIGALSIPVWTWLVQKTSLRIVITCGALVGGISFIILANAAELLTFYIFYTLAWVSGQCFGGPIINMLVNNWFIKSRGRAFGLANVGISLSGAIMPFILLLFINKFDVSTAWFGYGCFLLAFVPVCWLLIRDTPEELGLHADNSPHSEYVAPPPVEPVAWATIFRTKEVYYLSFLFGLTLTVSSAIVSQLKPRMVDVGLDSYQAMFFSCLTAAFLVVAKYIWGKAADKYNPVKVTRVLLICNFFSLLLIFVPPSLPMLFLFSFCFGISSGGAWVLMPATTSYYFGSEKFIFYYRMISTFILLKSLGYAIVGWSNYLTGGYNLSYIIFAGILIVCISLAFLIPTQSKFLIDEKVKNA